MTTFTLENAALRLEFNRENGALVGLTALESGWQVLNRPHLGLSYRLMMPLPGRRNNPVFGEKQAVTSIDIAADRRGATLVWSGVRSEFGGLHDTRITLQINLDARQAIY